MRKILLIVSALLCVAVFGINAALAQYPWSPKPQLEALLQGTLFVADGTKMTGPVYNTTKPTVSIKVFKDNAVISFGIKFAETQQPFESGKWVVGRFEGPAKGQTREPFTVEIKIYRSTVK